MYGAATMTINKLQRVQNLASSVHMVQRSDGRSTFIQIAPRVYHLQGRCIDIQYSYILNAVISVRPTTSRDIFAFVAVCRLLTKSAGALSLSQHQQCGTHYLPNSPTKTRRFDPCRLLRKSLLFTSAF